MSSSTLARTIRSLEHNLRESTAKIQAQLNEARAKCKHKYVVILCSAYQATDRWGDECGHLEARKCLVCGLSELGTTGEDFKVLLNPMKRFEFGSGKYFYEKISQTPLGDKTASLPKLLAWVRVNGYRVF